MSGFLLGFAWVTAMYVLAHFAGREVWRPWKKKERA